MKISSKICWIGNEPLISNKGNNSSSLTSIDLHDEQESASVSIEQSKANWLLTMLVSTSPTYNRPYTFSQLKQDYEQAFDDFEAFWNSYEMDVFREKGLLIL